jgi:pimeloyl-ACP methyl ester carboxylesterase
VGYPPIEPYETGMLDTGDGNLVYWETCGNPDGVPVLVVHGGPGSGCSTGMRKSWNPERHRIVLFDQRNCGRSTPNAADLTVDMSLNTTDHLITDMEALRELLGIDRWMLYGGSWGVTLSLAYAERHPERVFGMLMVGVTLTDRADWTGSTGASVGSSRRRGHGSATTSATTGTGCRRTRSRPSRSCSRRTPGSWPTRTRTFAPVPRSSGVPGRTRSSLRRSTASRASTATGRMTRGSRSCGSARTTSQRRVPRGRGAHPRGGQAGRHPGHSRARAQRPRRSGGHRMGTRPRLAGAELIIVEDSGHTGSPRMAEVLHDAGIRLYEMIK